MQDVSGSEVLSKLLVVDDKPENLFAMETILKHAACEVHSARSGNEALSLMLRHDFALALLDVQMPEMNGFELAEIMRSHDSTRYIPIIFVTAISKEHKHVFKGYHAGAVDYLFKPLDQDILLQKVKVFLELDRQKKLLTRTAGELEGANIKLERARDQLELRVEERTSDLLEANRSLNELRNDLRNIIDSMPSVLVGVGAGGLVTQWNPEAAKWTGISKEKAMGRDVGEVLPLLKNHMGKVHEVLKLHVTRRFEKIGALFEGRPCFMDMTVYPVMLEKETGAVIRLDDVTDRTRLEEMMVQSGKMLSVGGLAAGMAHEINNPLAGILQNMQVLKRRLSPSLPKNVLAARESGTSIESIQAYMESRNIFRMIDFVLDEGERASKIVDNLIRFSGQTRSEKIDIGVTRVLDMAVDLARTDFDLKQRFDFLEVDIQRDFPKEMLMVNCDVAGIQQVFLNILKNAAQVFCTGRTTSSPKLFLKVSREKGMAVVEIRDNGPGMDEKVRMRVFEPFFTTRETGQGMGLGLAVAYFIVTENHKGSLEVISAPGQGSAFIVRLPLSTDG